MVLLRRDQWDIAEVRTDGGVALIRYRTPVLSRRQVEGYDRVLKIVWAFSPDGTGALPTDEESARMKVFEDRFCEAVEHDGHAVLTAVLTFDGARQWVFYTGDVRECGARLEAMPQEAEPYPLELTTEQDPGWRYLHEEILKQVPWTDYPDDADGDALRRVALRSDMSLPMSIDFAVDVPSEAAGHAVARAATARGYSASVECNDATERWTCYCVKRMVATYDAVIAVQAELDELSAPLGGRSDGWGTLGNETATPSA